VTLPLHSLIATRASRRFARGLRCFAAGLAIAVLSAIGVQEARAATDDCRAQPDTSYLDSSTDRYIFPRDGIVAPYNVEKRVRIVKRSTGVNSGNLAPQPADLARTILFEAATSPDAGMRARPFVRRHGLSRAPPRAG
jgi:hypothetical protein